MALETNDGCKTELALVRDLGELQQLNGMLGMGEGVRHGLVVCLRFSCSCQRSALLASST